MDIFNKISKPLLVVEIMALITEIGNDTNPKMNKNIGKLSIRLSGWVGPRNTGSPFSSIVKLELRYSAELFGTRGP